MKMEESFMIQTSISSNEASLSLSKRIRKTKERASQNDTNTVDSTLRPHLFVM